MDKATRPSCVTTAVQLLYITLVISFVCGIINIVRIHSSPAGTENLGIGPMLVIVLISVAICWFFFYNISRGHNWARIIYLILFILGFITGVWHIHMYFAEGILVALATIVNWILGIIALVMLFTSQSNAWFKSAKSKTQTPAEN